MLCGHRDTFFNSSIIIQGLTRESLIEDDKGKKMEAMKVFSAAIGYLKDHFLSTCENQLTDIEDSDIIWVLTVPAIWSDPSKQFMREAAEKVPSILFYLIWWPLQKNHKLYCCQHTFMLVIFIYIYSQHISWTTSYETILLDTNLRMMVPVIKLFSSSIFLVSANIASSKIKTKNEGQCASFQATVHLIWPFCTVNVLCTEIILICMFFQNYFSLKKIKWAIVG